MALTVANRVYSNWGDKKVLFADITWDDAYAYGGETFDISVQGMSGVDRVVVEPKGGITFEYDYTNEKIMAYRAAPIRVVDEEHTIASNQITLNYPAAALLNMCTATVHQGLAEPGATLAANQCNLSAAMTWGTRPTITFHASTSGLVYCTYITQAWGDVWDNRQTSETSTYASNVGTLDGESIFIESLLASHATSPVNLLEFIRGGDAAAAGECEVDYTDSSNTTLTVASADSITGLQVTHIAKPSSGFLEERFVEDEDVAIASSKGSFLQPVLMPGLYGQIPDYTAANERDSHNLGMNTLDARGTAGDNTIDYGVTATTRGTQVHVKDASSDAVSGTYIWGQPYEVTATPLQVIEGADLSKLGAFKLTCIGR